jgi:hypothetical protein
MSCPEVDVAGVAAPRPVHRAPVAEPSIYAPPRPEKAAADEQAELDRWWAWACTGFDGRWV